ncbi:hypothetical protein G7Z17_g7109 [Cylindrodendrum hubeiense]|uniref:Uncharacterized protein n=1 Tax=Cylindrodendrum hubeiense TaxID=595255 RepID=A0A9P5LA72_9HYPO|nr:hypothetical protein G7Z17_g7109 [Cylindrodendrum hubeiense]
MVYESRDLGQKSARAVCAGDISSMVYNNCECIPHELAPNLIGDLYQLLTTEDRTPAMSEIPMKDEMEYDSKWLQSPKTFLSAQWCRLHYAFQTNKKWLNKFQLMNWLATMSYASENNPQVTQALLALSLSYNVSSVALPDVTLYDLSQGYEPKSLDIHNMITQCTKPLEKCPEATLPPLPNESAQKTKDRRRYKHQMKRDAAVRSFHFQILEQWPSATLQQPTGPKMNIYIDVASAMEPIRSKWRVWNENLSFDHYLENFVHALGEIPIGSYPVCSFSKPRRVKPPPRLCGFISIQSLFLDPPSSEAPTDPQPLEEWIQTTIKLDHAIDFLDSRAKFANEHHHLAELRSSFSRFQRTYTQYQVTDRDIIFQKYLDQFVTYTQATYDILLHATSGPSKHSPNFSPIEAGIKEIAFRAKFWPRISPIFFLQHLKRSRWSNLDREWQGKIAAYAKAVTALQQVKCLAQFRDNEVDLQRELEACGSLEEEAKYPDRHYRPSPTCQSGSTMLDSAEPDNGSRFLDRGPQFEIAELSTASLQEERERGLPHEAEQEPGVEQPSNIVPATHSVDKALRRFIKKGWRSKDLYFESAFTTLEPTTAAVYVDFREFPSHVLVTGDFSETTQPLQKESDSFQRPVQWILTAAGGDLARDHLVRHLLVLSPYEVNELLPEIEASRYVTLHIYSPRINLRSQPLDRLDLYTVPQRTTSPIISLEHLIHLNFFAGQLYLSSFQEYIAVCDALGLVWNPNNNGINLETGGFIPPGSHGGGMNKSGFSTSPAEFLKILMTKIRGNCDGIEKTHMGRVLDGVLLTQEDFKES